MKELLKSSKGFTFLELVLVMAITSVLIGFASINLFHAQNNTALNSSVTTLVADLKNQQINSMLSGTGGTSSGGSFGIHFTNSSYTIFHGLSFNPNDTNNLTVTLDPSVEFTNITFPNSNVIFATISGEFVNFSSNQNTIGIQPVSSSQKLTITINKYGIVTSIQ